MPRKKARSGLLPRRRSIRKWIYAISLECRIGSTGRANRLTPPSQCQRSGIGDQASDDTGSDPSCFHFRRIFMLSAVLLRQGFGLRRPKVGFGRLKVGGHPSLRRGPRLATRSCAAAKGGGANRNRTDDLMLAKHALSQLSYGPGSDSSNGRRKPTEAARGRPQSSFALAGFGGQPPLLRSVGWWARDELNVRPHAYQACALTT
jgi:hypothetical protein